MDRVSAYLLVKTHLRRPESRRRARRLEAIVEAISSTVASGDVERWGAFALLACIDDEYAEHNPEARGVTAAEQAALEGVDATGCAVLRGWREGALRASLGVEARVLAAALKVADESLEQLAEHPLTVEQLVEFYTRRRHEGDAAARWFDQSLELLGDHVEALARCASRGWSVVEEARP
jgi:hypothetical protein